MSIINFSNLKSLKDHFAFKNKSLVIASTSIAAGASIQSEIFNVKTSALNVGVRFGATTSSTAKLQVSIACLDDSDNVIYTSDDLQIERIAGATYASVQDNIPAKRIRITIKNNDTVAFTGGVVSYNEIDRENKFEHQVFRNRDVVAGDNVSQRFKIKKSALAINVYWSTEPDSYTLYARFYDKNNNIVSISTIHVGTTTNKLNRRMLSTAANTEFVDINVIVGSASSGRITSMVIKEMDNIYSPTISLADNTIKVDRSNDLSKLVFPSTVIAAGANVVSDKIELTKSNAVLNWNWSVRPQYFLVQALFYRGNTLVDTVDVFERRLGVSLTNYKAQFQRLGDSVAIKVTNTSETSGTLSFMVINQLDTPLVDNTWDNAYDPLNQSMKSTIQRESAGFDDFESAWRTKKIYRPDFYNTVFSASLKQNTSTVKDYFFLQKGVKMVRVYLKVTNIQGNPFGTDGGITLKIGAGEKDKGVETVILQSDVLKDGNHILLLGVKDEVIKSTSLLFGDRLTFELQFSGTIDATNYFTYELFAYSKF